MLKDLRKHTAKKLNLPPFVIFQDPSLEEMAIQYPIKMDEMKNIVGVVPYLLQRQQYFSSHPIKMDEMKNIVGVGAGKAQRYGQPFIDLILTYVNENEIERPQDMVVKSVINKSSLKVFIIQSIDRKIPLDDICNAKGIEFESLLDELEAIVYSGTKVNLSYTISQSIDEEKQADLYEYFQNADTDNLEAAIKELGEDDYSMEEIRLMRLKFISEMGN